MDDTARRALEDAARQYLTETLGRDAPQSLQWEGAFDETPLEGEGPTVLFSFALPSIAGGPAACAPPERQRHYVAIGQTTPNYFPTYGLNPDDGYSFHIGTRFLLEMRINRVPETQERVGAREALRARVREAAPNATITGEELAALFQCEEQLFAVYRLTLNSTETVYFMGGDCPPGFYRLTEHPPQVALRLHLGKLIRDEARTERRLQGRA